ncbi:hypothetical protein LVJ94_29250 [Pendulispora rubella]|uniref:3-methyl-2-oxobutanoate dehydrogenase (2-methylpropanoyl-transferring) n=1 Tax=Pendulispora rubella TaxID=2741070 RepID=A0ABZ2KQQ9_9BACT
MPHELARNLFEAQLNCRLVDIEAHELRARNEGYYTIASAGHEGNVALGALTRKTDPALLHYRSGAFFLARARAGEGTAPGVFELLLSLAASSDDPIAEGRHKVFGSIPWGIPPQTSTIASHLPKAVGMAVSIDRASKLGALGRLHEGTVPTTKDSIVVCSFGDASLNHSTAQGAINAASWAAYQRVPVPVLFLCEDNGLGVSVRTPQGWVEARMRGTPGMTYIAADGGDLSAAYEASERAVVTCRKTRAPVFLHLRCERVWGHAGSDADREYRAAAEIATAEQRDPVLLTAQSLLDAGVMSSRELLDAIDGAAETVRALSNEAVKRPKLRTRDGVMASIAPSRKNAVAEEARRTDYASAANDGGPKTLAHAIRAGLSDLMRKYSELVVFGEDVAEKGGVYGVTVGLWKSFGAGRVFNTLLDEQSILGMAIGAGQIGLLPVPEIQFLAYVHNAEDQLRGEAATLSFFSGGHLKNPMVVRIAGLGYQKGFGGHFHNDDSLAVLRDLPGVIVAVPSRGDDAVRMLRTLMASARIDGRVCVFVEPIALYHTRDLFPGDGAWSFPVPEPGRAIDVGEVGVYEPDARDLVMLTYGNGVPMCLRVARSLEGKGIRARVVDLRWIAPLPEEAIAQHVRESKAVLVVDECRHSGNVSEGIVTFLATHADLSAKPLARVASADSFIPLADAANLVLLQESEILHAALELVRSGESREVASGQVDAKIVANVDLQVAR